MELEEWADLAVAVGTGLLAGATFLLAWFTRQTIRQAGDGLKQADRHHQENLRPFCIVEFADVDNLYPFGRSFYKQLGFDYQTGPAAREVRIKGRLINKGLGPAKDVTVYLNSGSSIGGQAYWLTHPVVVCGVIAANESMEIDLLIPEHRVATTMTGGQRVPVQVLEWAARDAYEVVLRYKDIFENLFRTVHAKGFPQNLPIEVAIAGGNVEQEKLLATRQDKPTPVFLKDEQLWRTVADVPKLLQGLPGDDLGQVSNPGAFD